MTRVAISFLMSGALVRYRHFEWIVSYGRGTLPVVAGRAENFIKIYKMRAYVEEVAPYGVVAAFRKLHYDTVNVANPVIWRALMSFATPSQICNGTNYRYFGNDQMEGIARWHLSARAKAGILSGNANKVLPRLRRA